MERYAKTIISQFINFSQCEIEKVEGRVERKLNVYFRDGQKKVFRGDTWNAVAFEIAGFMRKPYFKSTYIDPLRTRERWILTTE